MLSMDDSSNGRAIALYLADPGSNPCSGSVWDHFVIATCIDGCIMSKVYVAFVTRLYEEKQQLWMRIHKGKLVG